jgi:SOS-response transcriptional repressor LexA
MSPKSQEVYDCIVQYYRAHGVSPSRKMLCKLADLRSTSVAQYYILQLVKYKLVVMRDRHPVPVSLLEHIQKFGGVSHE